MANDVALFEHRQHEGGRRRIHHYRECGLDNIWLLGGFRFEPSPSGPALVIEDHRDLHRKIGLSIVHRGDPITGRELWFLRHELNLTQEHLARLLDADVQAVARWEKGRSRVPGPADRLIRYLYLNHVSENENIRDFLEALAELDRITESKRVFRPTAAGWAPAAA